MNPLFTIDCGEIMLREYRVEDADAIYEITSQPEVHEFLPDFKTTREQRLDWSQITKSLQTNDSYQRCQILKIKLT
ncbi:RimJ/RimL family protein N-acetyltransferase [Lysinibacillus composti]|nr:RimJ/RimL family protein N-acetyltransferase [Lysinibacillus composti]